MAVLLLKRVLGVGCACAGVHGAGVCGAGVPGTDNASACGAGERGADTACGSVSLEPEL